VSHGPIELNHKKESSSPLFYGLGFRDIALLFQAGPILKSIVKTQYMDAKFLSDCEQAAAVYRAINHPIRRQMLEQLEAAPKNVTELQIVLRLEQTVTSQHLAALRDAKLVKVESKGKFKLYSINTGGIEALKTANITLGFL
jgi:DNA-binding transcriptional ArsR family regulator